MKNRVKIIDFLTLLRITRKLIITEQCTKNFKDLVLSYEFTKKKLFKSVKKISELLPAEVRPSARSWPEEGGGVLQWLYI